jgi:uncharacterized Zn finger protein
MKCPNCGNRNAIAVDMHSGGFTAESSPVKECGECGLVWCIKTVGDQAEIDIIKEGTRKV